jgi:hypothetical protein
MFVKPAPETDAPMDVHVNALPDGLLMTKVFDSSAIQIAKNILPAGARIGADVTGLAVPKTALGVETSSAIATSAAPPYRQLGGILPTVM